MKRAIAAVFGAIGAIGLLGACSGPDTSVCNELPSAALCPSGTSPLQTVPGGSDCVSEAQGHCGDLYITLEQCGIDHPTCVSSNGTADPNTLQSCDAEQTAWDDCITNK